MKFSHFAVISVVAVKWQNTLAVVFSIGLFFMAACTRTDYPVELHYTDSTSGRELPYSVPQHVNFQPLDSSVGALRLPDGHGHSPLVGQWQLGNSNRPIHFLLDKSSAKMHYYDRLFVDLDSDNDFTNDSTAYSGKGSYVTGRNRYYVEFEKVALPYKWHLGQTVSNEKFLGKYYFWNPDNAVVSSGRLVRSSWREGTFAYQKRQAFVILVDDDCNGTFDTNDRWALFPADSLGSKYVASLRLFRNSTQLGWIDQTAFELAEISPRGDRVLLRVKKVEITPADDFAHDSPYAEEPRRPLAARDIAWQTDMRAATAVARKTKKLILLNFCTAWSGPCKVMDERTFLDAEVVTRSDSFICVRVDGDRRRDLVAKYKVENYPTAIVVDYRGVEHTRVVGYQPATEFSAFLSQSVDK